jgi:DNA polymerase-3 subunit epsilon
MSDDAMLFGEPATVEASAPARELLPDWQVANLRKALDALGVDSMTERQALIEDLAGRPVAALRDLTFAEARQVSEALAARRRTEASTGSAWDNRDEDTWIDRL